MPLASRLGRLRRLRRAERILRQDIVKRGIGHADDEENRGAGKEPARQDGERCGFKGNPP